MKKILLLGLVATGMTLGANNALAGFSFSISLGSPYPPPVVYSPPPRYCPPPVVYRPAPVVCPPPVAVCPPPVRVCAPPVFYAPAYREYAPPRRHHGRGYYAHAESRGWGGYYR